MPGFCLSGGAHGTVNLLILELPVYEGSAEGTALGGFSGWGTHLPAVLDWPALSFFFRIGLESQKAGLV